MALMCESSSLSFSLQDKYVQGVCSGALVLKPWSLTLLSPPHLQTLNGALKKVIKTKLRAECSPRHVPAAIFACPDIPYTLSGKVREHHNKLALCELTVDTPPSATIPCPQQKVELAVKKLLMGQKVLNADALKNPTSLAYFRDNGPAVRKAVGIATTGDAAASD